MTSVVAFPGTAAPGGFFWKIPLVIWFLAAAFLPATVTPQYTLFDIPFSCSDLFLVTAAAIYFGVLITSQDVRSSPPWHRNLPLWFAVMLGYAAISIRWADLDLSNSRAMAYTLCLAGAAFLLPYSVLARLSANQVRSVLRLASIGIVAAGAIYSLESFFSLGLRSELGQFYSVGFGIERVKGPLFQASTGHIVLLPAAAWLAQDLFTESSHRFYKILGLIVLAVAILGLGSRAAIALMGVLVIAIILSVRGVRHKSIIAVCVLGGTALAAAIVFTYASADRLHSFEDARRISTHLMAFNAVENRSIEANLQGAGYGAFWPWYLPDTQLADLIVRGADMRKSEYGDTLYQPHSALLVFAMELGLAGLAFFVKLWSTIGRCVATAWQMGNDRILALGVAVTSLSMFADLIIFKNPKVSALWWFYLLAALAMQKREIPQVEANT